MSAASDVAYDDPSRPPVLGCESCGLTSANAFADEVERPGDAPRLQKCPRCGHVLHVRKPLSLQRTWASTVAAAVLYVPANVLPIMTTVSALQHDDHTLLGGIRELWIDGSWGLSIIVFIASIAVPVLKIGALALLAWSTQYAPAWRRLDRARLYRLIEAVGHWSMLDVYVVVLLAATIRYGSLASVQAGPGLLAFAAVVVLTMLATYAFDPKLIWDDPRPAARRGSAPPNTGVAEHAGRSA
ncbi:MAG: paraquat-inducible protein A [Burkholderiales bacterium]|nr:paraquat-inducible protein A [Burkholderiales bacterium]